MVATTLSIPDRSHEQRLHNLGLANTIRIDRAKLRRRIARGETTVAQVITDLPAEARSWAVGELLAAQRQWGATRARKVLHRLQISETRPVGSLTERQRRLLAELGGSR